MAHTTTQTRERDKMDGFFKEILKIINNLKAAGLFKLVIASISFIVSIVFMQFLYRFINKRYKLQKIRGSIYTIIFLIAIYIFLQVIGQSNLVSIVRGIIFFFVILTSIKIIDHTFIEDFLIKKKKFRISRLVRDTIKGGLFIILVLIMLKSVFGVSIEGIGVTAAVATGVIGFALQDTLSSVIAGISISRDKPFRVGDWVKISGIEGKVEQISWRTTRIQTFNDDYIIIPNHNISKTEIFNFYTPTKSHARLLKIGVDYRHPPEQVKNVIMESIKSTPNVIDIPKPVVWVVNYNDFSIDYNAKFWINDFSNYPEVENNFYSKLWYNFRRNNIIIPFPIHDVRITNQVQPLLSQAAQITKVDYTEVRDFEIFKTLNIKDFKVLSKHLVREVYGKDEIILKKGDEGRFLYLINYGSVLIDKNPENTSSQLFSLNKGEIFGEVSMITGVPITATITTAKETELFKLDRKSFKSVLKNYQTVAQKIGKIIESRKHAEKVILESKKSKAVEKKEPSLSVLANLKKYFGL
ncbi:MAG: mechanosensitive ion channel [Spirochaetes bacterium]|nr:mechanosensitive ion channel [Spirochaetota bacterium]